MEKKETFIQFLMNRLGKCIHASIGLFIFPAGIELVLPEIKSNPVNPLPPWKKVSR